ncbi:N-acetyltransferase [Shewanella litoralis]|uniref:N-acetyltransferase n=2 Tax=Shewanella litoralis TaxID=2282700 RepID=A0ABQ2RI31_9GAMM|nr:N-acetyltransferase [Shewanella litoralis]
MPIRPICLTDWSSIMTIQAQCYVELTPESLSVMQSKWLASPATCVVFEQAQQVLAYALVHPWTPGDAPSLAIEITTQDVNSWYLHDMAIAPNAQGLGIGKQLLTHILNQGRALDIDGIGLVAVQDAHSYWLQQGFKPHATSTKLTQSLSSYPANACYLYLTLA